MKFYFVFSKSRDPDLFNLYYKIGRKNFRKGLKYSLESLADSSYICKASECFHTYENTEINSSELISFIMEFNPKKFKNAYEILSSCTKRAQKAIIVRYAMRRILGVNEVINYLLGSDLSINSDIYYPINSFNLPEIYSKSVKTIPTSSQIKTEGQPENTYDEININTGINLNTNADIDTDIDTNTSTSASSSSDDILDLLSGLM